MCFVLEYKIIFPISLCGQFSEIGQTVWKTGIDEEICYSLNDFSQLFHQSVRVSLDSALGQTLPASISFSG